MSKLKGSARLGALAVVFGLGCLAAIGVTPQGPADASSSPVPGIGVCALGGHLTGIANPNLFSTVIGDTSVGSTLQGLAGRSLVYFASPDVNTQWNSGVTYQQATANNWLLRDSSGTLLVNQGYANDYIGDVGSSGYQNQWISNVESYLSAHPGIDGVFIDDVVYDLKPLAGTEAAKYPTQQQWAAAELSFAKVVGQALRAAGYYVAVNASGYIPGDANSNDGTNTVTWWQELGPYVNGLMNEYYDETSNGTYQLRATGTAWYQSWDGWQRLVQTAQSMGDDFFGLTYDTAGNTTAMTYGKASFLLDWNGGGGAFMYAALDGSDPTSSAWTTDIGTPTASKQQVGTGWMRTYTGGVALVNPSATSAQTFQLGHSYVTPAGTAVTSVTLQPTTAIILTGSNAPTTTTTTTTPPTTTTSTTTTAPTTTTTWTTTPTTTTTTTTTTPTTTTTTATTTTSTTTTAPPTTTTATTTTTPTTTTTTKPHGRKRKTADVRAKPRHRAWRVAGTFRLVAE